MKIFSTYTGYEYTLKIYKPETIDENTPVYYVLDGLSYYQYAKETIRLQSLNTIKTKVEKAVVVGICHQEKDMRARRYLDYTAPAKNYVYPERMKNHLPEAVGGAEKFHQFMELECKPFIYKALSFQPKKEVLFGHSLSGYYVLWTLLHHPESYEGLIAISPSVWWNDLELLKQVKEVKVRDTAGVFLAVGEQEIVIADDVRSMYEELKQSIKNIEFYIGLEENHASIVPHIISKAFRFVSWL